MTKRSRLALAVVLPWIPLLVAAAYVFSYAVDVPYYDQWQKVPFIEKYLSGQLSFWSLFARHDGHVAFLERFFTILSVSLFHWNALFEIGLGFAFLVSTGLLLAAHLLTGEEGRSSAARLHHLFPVAVVIFSVRQWENLLAPWAVSFFGSTLFVLAACYFASKEGVRPFVLSLLAAALATVTFTNGLLVWLIVPLQRMLQREAGPSGQPPAPPRLRRWGAEALWGALGCAAWGAFLFAGKSSSFAQPDRGRLASMTLKRMFTGLGLALSPDKAVVAGGAFPLIILPIDASECAALGFLLALLAAWSVYTLWRARDMARGAFALSMTLFGAASIAMAAAGRANLGLQQMLSSRYSSASAIFVAGAFMLAERATRGRPIRTCVMAVLVTLIVTSNLTAALTEFHVGPSRRGNLVGWGRTIREFRTATDEQLQNPHFTPSVIRAHCAILERYHLSVFKEERPPG